MADVVIRMEPWKSPPLIFGLTDVEYGADFAGARVAVVDTKPLIEKMIRNGAARNLRGIVRPGVGYDNVPIELCRDLGIVCAYTPNAPSRAVAELTMGLIVTAARGVLRADTAIRRGMWERQLGPQLSEMTLGVLGCGRIGKRVVALARAFGMAVLVADPVADTTFDDIYQVRRVTLPELLATSDVVTVHVPRTGNVGLLGERELRWMKPSGILINTSRGGIVDERALCRVLKAQRGMTAAVDVYDREPYQGPLIGLPNIVLTAHMGAITLRARLDMEGQAMDAVRAILEGQRPQWLLPELDDGGKAWG